MKTSVGTKLGPYVLCARLGRGAQGEVWRADGPNGAVALKLVLQRDAETMIRAWREARLQRRARSPHVVEVMDNFVHEGVPVIVMELVDGMSLKEVLRNGRPTLGEADTIAHALFAAVEAAHTQGMVHRDLKPANVLLTSTAEGLMVKLTDFGVAREQDTWNRGPQLTMHGRMLGTPGFIAPEVVQEGSPAGTTADLFSLGALLFAVLTGQRPFRGPTPYAILAATLSGQYPSVRSMRPEVPAPWGDAIDWALRPDPAARVPTVAVLREAWRGKLDVPHYDYGEDSELTCEEVTVELRSSPQSIGRVEELVALRGLTDRHRLVTIVGPPGIGKSHLAEQVAHCDVEERARVVPLAEVQDGSGMVVAVALALGVPLTMGDTRGTVVQALGNARGVVVIDNAEHLVDELATLLGQVLGTGTDATFLVTSRRALGLADEVVYQLGPLKYEDATRLFESVSGRTAEDTVDVEAMREIVAGLEHNPLAVVLAAGHVGDRDLSDVAVELVERTTTLGLDASPMTAALEWSWDLLSKVEQHALAQCSVFRGGFTFEGAAAVVDLSAWPDAPPVTDVLESLVRHSLLVPDTVDAGVSRLRSPAAVRKHAAMRLATPGGLGLLAPKGATGPEAVKAVKNRHARWYARLGDPGLREWRHTESGMLDLLSLHLEARNLEEALQHGVEHRLGDCVAQLALALADATEGRAPILDSAAWIGQALTVRLEPASQSWLLFAQGRLLNNAGKTEAGQRQLERARAIAEAAGEEVVVNRVDLQRAINSYVTGDLEGALQQARGVLSRIGEESRDGMRLSALRVAGCALQYLGDLDAADAAFDECVRLAGQWEYPLQEAQGHLHKGSMAEARLEPERAIFHYTEAIGGARRSGQRELEARLHTNLGGVYSENGSDPPAAEHLEQALAISRDLGSVNREAIASGNLGAVRTRQGRFDEAEELLQRALEISEKTWPVASGAWLGNLARLRAHQGQIDAALDMLDEAEARVKEAHTKTWLGLIGIRAEIALEIGREDIARAEVARLKQLHESLGEASGLSRLLRTMPEAIRAMLEEQ